MHDVIIVGGSYAGLSAALQLGRARRSVLIIDAGQRRNRSASSSHGFLTRDGERPDVIAALAREEVLTYPTVEHLEAEVSVIERADGSFTVHAGGETLRAHRLILATGVVDELPDLPGLPERWGRTAFHCPYCHGYELQEGRLGLLATSPMGLFKATLVEEWAGPGALTLFIHRALTHSADGLDEGALRAIAARGVTVERTAVARLGGEAPHIEAHLEDGRCIALDGMFIEGKTRVAGPFAEQLGCALEAGPIGSSYKTDERKLTSVPGVFACGDAALMAGTVALAVADGFRAGAGAHQSLLFGGEGLPPVARARGEVGRAPPRRA